MRIINVTMQDFEVRAIREGRKTQFRRIVQAEHLPFIENMTNEYLNGNWESRPMPYGQIGDKLLISETLALENKALCVERLQEISNTDLLAEGVEPLPYKSDDPWDEFEGRYMEAFKRQWATVWKSNPRVWVVEFEPQEVTSEA